MQKLLAMVLFFAVSFSVQADPRKDKAHPCAKDFPLYCQDEIPSDKNEWKCLGEKMNVLSEQCSKFMKENVYLKLNDCGKEILDFCPGSKMNYGSWSTCLEKRKADLSNKCSRGISKIDKVRKVRADFINSCKDDFKKLCKESDVRQCPKVILREDPSKLSPGCKSAVDALGTVL